MNLVLQESSYFQKLFHKFTFGIYYQKLLEYLVVKLKSYFIRFDTGVDLLR